MVHGPVSQEILSLGNSVARQNSLGNTVAELHNFLGNNAALRKYCRLVEVRLEGSASKNKVCFQVRGVCKKDYSQASS